MGLTNTTKPSAANLDNSARVVSYETWATIATTWAAETRTWAECASFMDNSARQSSSLTNTAKPS